MVKERGFSLVLGREMGVYQDFSQDTSSSFKDVLVIDYLQLIESSGPRLQGNRKLQKYPESWRKSGAIEQDADIAILKM